MKKELLKAKVLLVALMMVATTAMFVACDDPDDVDDDNPAGQLPGGDDNDPGKTEGEALNSPELTYDQDANGNLVVSWTHVSGARAYAVEVKAVGKVTETGEVEADETVYAEAELESTSFSFPMTYGYRYAGTVKSLGDSTHADATEATAFEYFYYVAPVTVPAGDLAETLAKLLAEETEANSMVEYALVAGLEYTLNAPIDFAGHNVTVKSVANVGTEEEPVIVENGEHAVVVFGQDGTFRAGNQITLLNLSIDASAQVDANGNVTKPTYLETRTSPGWGIVEGSFDETALAAASQETGGLQNFLLKSITIDGCFIKDVPCNLTHSGDYAWVFDVVNVTNSIIQLNNNGHYGDATVFGTYGGGLQPDGGTNWRVGAIRDLKVENSTIYNIQKNSKNRMLRWNGNNRSHHFVGDVNVAITFNNVTLSQVMTAKEFANGTWNNKDWATITFTNNVYRDCFRVLNKMNVRGCANVVTNNLGWCSGVDESGDPEGSKGDDESTIEELGGDAAVKWTSFTFGGNVNAQLDLTKENGGVNFKTSAASATQGDPRWN